MKKTIFILIVFVAVSLNSGAARAFTMRVMYKEYGQSGYLMKAGVPMSVGTVEFGVSLLDDAGAGLSSRDGSDWFSAFCIQLDQTIAAGGGAIPVDLVSPGLVPGGMEAAWIMDNRDTYLVPEYRPWEITALQLAIWEVTHDPDDGHQYDLLGGDFFVTAFPGESVRQAGIYLDSLVSFYDPAGLETRYQAALNPEYQDLLVKMDLPQAGDPVPEPATLWLLGIGLIGLAGIMKRRRNKSSQRI